MNRIILLCGHSCAGKTLGASFLAEHLGYPHIEASAIMRELWAQASNELSLDDFAAKILGEAPESVPAEALRRAGDNGAVISGLRSPKEVAAVFEARPKVGLIFITASFECRLERAVHRARPGHVSTAEGLHALDRLHASMGLSAVAADPRTATLANEGGIELYWRALSEAAGDIPD